MAPQRWTTPEQMEWLLALLNTFCEHQRMKKTDTFWIMLKRDWFKLWPEEPLIFGPDPPERKDMTAEQKEKLNTAINARMDVSFRIISDILVWLISRYSSSARGSTTKLVARVGRLINLGPPL